MAEPEWELRMTALAERQLALLPGVAARMVASFVHGPLSTNPHLGRRAWTGQWLARRGWYHVIYDLDEDRRAIVIQRIDNRAGRYRPR
jgi:mRNA interferase RelE/StbE